MYTYYTWVSDVKFFSPKRPMIDSAIRRIAMSVMQTR